MTGQPAALPTAADRDRLLLAARAYERAAVTFREAARMAREIGAEASRRKDEEFAWRAAWCARRCRDMAAGREELR